MTGTTISKFGKFYRIIGESGPMAVQTPTHVHDLGIFGNVHGAHIAMTSFAVQACRDMGAMYEMDKVRDLRHWNPGNVFIVQDVVFKNCQFWTRIGNLHLLMTAPALCGCWQPWRRSA